MLLLAVFFAAVDSTLAGAFDAVDAGAFPAVEAGYILVSRRVLSHKRCITHLGGH